MNPRDRGEAASRMADAWMESIAAGRIRAGEEMPKIRWLAAKDRASHSTVVDALRILEGKELLHKTGHSWVVGPRMEQESRHAGGSAVQTVLLVSNRPQQWSQFHDLLLSKFAQRFGMEADRYNVRMRAVLTTWNDGKAPPFPCGRQEIAKVVRNLKKDYLGALLLPPRREMPDFDEWVRILDRFRRPVVWLQDMDTTQPVPPNRHLIRMSYGDWGKEDEDSVTGIVVRELWKRGHRVAGIASSVSWHSQWLPRRIENLRKATVRTGCPLEIRTSLDWSGNSTEAEVLAPLLSDPGLTALICPNDEEAGLQYTAVKETGREVPRDISMVSFDNAPWLRPFPVSSVDFGTDGLGYKAFHLLLGLVPVHIGRKRLLQGDNILVDNGSIGPPRRR